MLRNPDSKSRRCTPLLIAGQPYSKKNPKTSGTEVYCTNALLFLIKIMLCSKIHRQKILNLHSFPIKPALDTERTVRVQALRRLLAGLNNVEMRSIGVTAGRVTLAVKCSNATLVSQVRERVYLTLFIN